MSYDHANLVMQDSKQAIYACVDQLGCYNVEPLLNWLHYLFDKANIN